MRQMSLLCAQNLVWEAYSGHFQGSGVTPQEDTPPRQIPGYTYSPLFLFSGLHPQVIGMLTEAQRSHTLQTIKQSAKRGSSSSFITAITKAVTRRRSVNVLR